MIIDVDLTKKIVIVLSFAATLSSVSVFLGLLSDKYDRALSRLEKAEERVAFLESQSASKSEMDKYQNIDRKRIYTEIKEIKEALFVPRSDFRDN